MSTSTVHAFPSARSIVAWCGAVNRPTAPRQEFRPDETDDAAIMLLSGAPLCVDCIRAHYGDTVADRVLSERAR